jgi:hypothetical protein
LAGVGGAAGGSVGRISATFSRRRRTTGASIVDDADRTNSPMSLTIFNSSLLSSPSSFASSWTRTLATDLLQVRDSGADQLVVLQAHFEVLIELS